MKLVLINVRIPIILKEHLDANCKTENTTISEIVRDIIHQYYEPEEDELKFEESPGHFVNSEDFKFLFKWIVDKRVNHTAYYDKSTLINLKVVLLNIQENNEFPVYIQQEFKKVQNEITNALVNYTGQGSYFSFGLPTCNNPFNYSIVIDFILTHNLCNTVFI